ncbi:hypothetical protein C5167_023768 [Papaver somniferum]|uniref:Uncharacterized protein n=1 Tax=Papaver somniferum TaxID=3469 RepID=A0A4Y7JQL2_PAPSO|nr:protein LURP-one-related 5-like [Papaver somniferum]RZC62029.1 hypothetical protein C5167_023768 [Papaver somniferum]
MKLQNLMNSEEKGTMIKEAAHIVNENSVFQEETQLTVRKTSLFSPGDGFSVYDCKGEVVFRVDSYGHSGHEPDELVLMDASGKCLLTVRRKRPSLHHRWEGYVGERSEGQKPIFSVKRSSIIGKSSVTVEVYNHHDHVEEYQVDGLFSQRCCTFYNTSSVMSKEVVAEVKRKVDAANNVLLGKDVFTLCVKPGFDAAFAMGLVLVLDQINGNTSSSDDDDDGSEENLVSSILDPITTINDDKCNNNNHVSPDSHI